MEHDISKVERWVEKSLHDISPGDPQYAALALENLERLNRDTEETRNHLAAIKAEINKGNGNLEQISKWLDEAVNNISSDDPRYEILKKLRENIGQIAAVEYIPGFSGQFNTKDMMLNWANGFMGNLSSKILPDIKDEDEQ